MAKKMGNTLSVSIVLPNWNGKHLLEKNLPLVIEAAPSAQIIVADDASSDGSVELVKQKFPLVSVVSTIRRQGFAGNVDSGVAKATGEIVVLLNTDVRPAKNFLAPLLQHFSDPTVAAVGCLEESHDADGVVMRGRGVARWTKGYFIHTKGEVTKSDTAWVAGGSGAYRRSIWNMLGGMDTIYNPFYWEDIDLSYQMQKAGYRILFEKKSIVGHYHEEGSIKSAFTPADVTRIAYRNQFIFIWKNLSDFDYWLAHCFWTPIRLLQAVIYGDFLMVEGYYGAIMKLVAIWSTRRRAARLWRRTDAETLPQSD